MSAVAQSGTWNYEQAAPTETVESLIRHTHAQLAAAHAVVSPSRVSRLVRAYVARHGVASGRRMVNRFVDSAASDYEFGSWCLSYEDPTGDTAVRNIMAGNR